ncbi:MAG TPA: DHA2 family efflux MFS transporter permease subunit, partial [Acidimicrobiales bacterium]|nr:DHA2 family efflux MFS transporter permease subunit [Acidimicrobiales bacterium]
MPVATPRSRAVWAVVITGLALFMASLDNLVVSTALPVIRVHLHAGLSGLEWTVNAYTLTFAVLLLTAAALGERFGRRRVFVAGIALFTASSAAAALAPDIGALVAARALQGAGGAMIMPLSLTLLSASVRPERRNAALGIWGAIGGTAVAIGPLVGGAVTGGWAWQYIFWLNVPVGLALVPLARWRLAESRGSAAPLDLAGVALVSTGLFGVVLGLVRGNAHGWTSPSVLASFVVGSLALAAFVAWELRSHYPMLDIRLFARRGFASVNMTALLFSFGMFGAIFFLTQFLQTVQGYSPLSAGVRVLPWTAVPMVLAPVVGQLAERWGGKPLVVTGLSLQAVGLAWLAAILAPGTPYADMIAPF